jgi:uncharacterized protein (TIGR02646 family)
MKQIRKGAEPPGLRKHRLDDGRFDDAQGETRWKEQTKRQILRDQGGLCCYCMARISLGDMKVEHYLCQDDHADQDCAWDNLFGACQGGTGQPPAQQHCDTRKGNAALTIHPCGNIEPFLRYLADGSLASSNPDYQRDIDDTLNLNLEKLRRARLGVLEGAVYTLTSASAGEWKLPRLQEELERWESRDADGNFRELCQVVIEFLRKRIRRA